LKKDRVNYFWFNLGLRSPDDLDMIKVSLGLTKFTIEFGNRDISVKRIYFKKEVFAEIKELFKSKPLFGTTSLEEAIMIDSYRK